ncbi:MAG: VWA domain-containing protein [Halieaceae bacterium]
MSDRDEQIDGKLRDDLSRIEIPPADPAARRLAIDAAMAEFEEVQQAAVSPGKSFQGLRDWLRPIVRFISDDRRNTMFANQRLLITGLGAACVGLVAVGVTLQYQPPVDSYSLPGEEVSIASRRERLLPGKADDEADFALREGEPSVSRAVEEQVQRESVAKHKPHTSADKNEFKRQVQSAAVGGLRADMPKDARVEKIAQPGMVLADSDAAYANVYQEHGRDRFEAFEQNSVKRVVDEPVSTFSVDVDTASYSFVRRQLNHGVLPQADAVRAEEMINYFDYDYAQPDNREQPFATTVAISDSPWAQGRKLLHVGIKGYDLAAAEQPRSNLVFLLDVSGSMNSPDKLPLVKQSMELLLTSLQPEDTVAIAVYAGAAGTVLEPTPVKDKHKIIAAMNQLSAGGSTAGAQGIRLAYELAAAQFDKDAVNRVILATDGDFNVGISSDRELQSFIERKRDAGIFLSVLGFGQGNYQDQMMQTLAQNGNGVAAYIDTLGEAQKVLVDQATSSLFPIAKDVKIQIEFNPATVAEYRLIGYETRHLNREDFNNDAVDAGDIGAGHTVTAIYEITPADSAARYIDDSRYAGTAKPDPERALGQEYAFLKLRYKLPAETESRLLTEPVKRGEDYPRALQLETDFATAVAGFAQLLKGGRFTGSYSYDEVIALAQASKGADPYGYRTEFIQLVRKAKTASAMQAR